MKLTYQYIEGVHHYQINNSKPFNPKPIPRSSLYNVFNFAFEMCLGSGHHRNHRSGGRYDRKKGEMFSNVFQGKIAEAILYEIFSSAHLNCANPDYSVSGEGIWDDTDLIVNEKKISVKSAASFSNLLLLEAKDWNRQGQYIPNLKPGGSSVYDYFILVRIQPDLKKILKDNRLFYSDVIEKKILETIIFSYPWNYDVAGYTTCAEIVDAIAENSFMPQKAILNKRIPMDADNYYIQSGDMHALDELLFELRKTN